MFHPCHLYCLCSFSLFQCSSCVPSLVAPAGRHITQQSGCSNCFAASHIPTRGQDSESPGGRLPPSGAGGLHSVRSCFFGRKSAGHNGTSDPSPDQDAGVSGSQGNFTGSKIKCCFYCCAYCECINNSVWIFLCISIGSGFCTSEESVC